MTYRLALDHPERVIRVGIVEIVPTADFWRAWNAELAFKAYHWTFLAQPAPLPEMLIGADPVGYVEHSCGTGRWGGASTSSPRRARRLQAAGARPGPDRRHVRRLPGGRDDGPRHRRGRPRRGTKDRRAADVPLRRATGFPAQTGRPGDTVAGWAEDVRTATCESGHFAMEENPQAVLDAFLPFFSWTASAAQAGRGTHCRFPFGPKSPIRPHPQEALPPADSSMGPAGRHPGLRHHAFLKGDPDVDHG